MPTNLKENKNMDAQQQQLVDRIQQAQNILVAVSASPSVDQLSAAIALALVVNKLNKHGTAVFSGAVPSTLEFLKPDETLEKNTDSLRDFIIALDKSKADKLRYKVEDDVVRIFITPYKTSITDKDLEFSQGDFNVDVVVALGVTVQADLDSAITAHGRILHDATVASVSTESQGELGSINWVEPNASSLCEMVVSLADALDKKAMDEQIATALLTGIVANTERFRNDKTTPKTMSASAELMAAGANPQLVATQLETPEPEPEPEPEPAPEPEETPESSHEQESDNFEAPTEDNAVDSTGQQSDEPEQQASEEALQVAQPEETFEPDEKPVKEEAPKPEPGTLEIDHEAEEVEEDSTPEPEPESDQPQIDVDENGKLTLAGDKKEAEIAAVRGVGSDGTATDSTSELKRELITEPPKIDSGDLTANTKPEATDLPTEELSLPSPLAPPLLSHTDSVLSGNAPLQPAPVDWQAPTPSAPASDSTAPISDNATDEPQLPTAEPAPASAEPAAHVDDARSAVEAALNGAAASNGPLEPITALNAQPLGPEIVQDQAFPAQLPTSPFGTAPSAMPAPMTNTGFSEPTPGNSPADETLDMPIPANPFAGNPLMTQASAPPTSAFPGAPAPNSDQNGSGQAPPPVPPPMLPPLQ